MNELFLGLYAAGISSLAAIAVCLINNYLLSKKMIMRIHEKNCPCLNKVCERHGNCYECVRFHRSKNGIIFCMQAEKNNQS